MKKPARGGLERFRMDGKWSNEKFSKAMAAHVTELPLNERITALHHADGQTYFSTVDDHGTVRFYDGPPPEGMPSVAAPRLIAPMVAPVLGDIFRAGGYRLKSDPPHP